MGWDMVHRKQYKKLYRKIKKKEIRSYMKSWNKRNPELRRLNNIRWNKNNPEWVRNYFRKRYEKKLAFKLTLIKKQGYICPGCGKSFKNCRDFQLLLCFDVCHIHSRRCKLFPTKQKLFCACRSCNIKQKNKCGYWLKPGLLKLLCKKET